jgi:lipoprotein-releasing system permease protein
VNWRDITAISTRYTFAFGRGHLSTFLSSLSMLGLVLAIAVLITVLSVMNGFDKEMRERILALVPHITVYSHLPIEQWQDRAQTMVAHPQVVTVSPFAQFDALFMRGSDIETARGIGLDVEREVASGEILTALSALQVEQFRSQPNGLVLGAGLARKLGVQEGEQLTLIVPGKGPSGIATRTTAVPTQFETLVLAGVLETGTELDQSAALLHLPLAAKLAGLEGQVSGFRVATSDIFDVSRIAWEMMNNLPRGYYASNWMMTHGNLYSAIQLSRDLVSILLFSIIGIAAFNVVSSLVLVVFDKQGDIAILRTLGASPANIAAIFVIQGAMIGLAGVILGSVGGVLISLAVPDLVALLEGLLGYQFLNTDVYPVSFLPVDILVTDVIMVSAVAFLMCVVAALYPALRAARLAPAKILHEE